MLLEPVHHIYDFNNKVLAHSLTSEELEEKIKELQQNYKVLTLDPPPYQDASY
jgi:hypothetical protein